MEFLIYEMKPWFFAIVSLWAVVYSSQSTTLLYSGLLLALSAGLIIYARISHRLGKN